MSYNASGGHGYGNQPRGSSKSFGQKKRSRQSDFKLPSQLNDARPEASTVFSPQILVSIPGTFTQPSQEGILPNMPVSKQAFQLAQVLTTRKELVLQLVEPNQSVLKFKVLKIENLDDLEIAQQPIVETILPNQSYNSFEYIASLRSELGKFGYQLIPGESK